MTKVVTLLSRGALVERIREVIDGSTNPPAEELIALGKAMTQLGTILRGQPPEIAKQALEEAMAMLEQQK